jgi:hypothetical protein
VRSTPTTVVLAGIIRVTLFGIFLTLVFAYVIRRFSGRRSLGVAPLRENPAVTDGAPTSTALAAQAAGHDCPGGSNRPSECARPLKCDYP